MCLLGGCVETKALNLTPTFDTSNPSNTHMNESKVSLGLIKPKSPTNVGGVMRAAGCFRVDSVFYTGERYARAARFNMDTKNVSGRIP